MSVMPIWMVERNLSGSSMIRSARCAPAFPCRARSSRLERRAEISAISQDYLVFGRYASGGVG